jgi:hypothetical protein
LDGCLDILVQSDGLLAVPQRMQRMTMRGQRIIGRGLVIASGVQSRCLVVTFGRLLVMLCGLFMMTGGILVMGVVWVQMRHGNLLGN